MVPVALSRHAGSSVEAGRAYGFSSALNAVPLMAVEMPTASSEYAIVFVKSGEALMPAVILGLGKNRNLYLDEDDVWQARYLPAFVRRYPFVFASGDGKTFALCIDEGCPGFNNEGRGERLFDDDGKPAAYVEQALKFLQTYQVQFKRTQAFCRKLDELGLFEPMHAQMKLDDGERLSLIGFLGVNRKKLAQLPDATLAAMAKSGELELIYSHLHSLGNLAAVRERASRSRARRQDASVSPAAPASATRH